VNSLRFEHDYKNSDFVHRISIHSAIPATPQSKQHLVLFY
jgi:hypothetical protein